MDTTARVGTAVAAGYLFGRFKKLRLALIVGTALASEDVRKSAVGLATHGTSGLASGGAGRLASQAGSKIVDVGRSAAVAAASSRLERISDRLAERTEALQGGAGTSSQRDDADEDDDEYDEPEDVDEEDEPEDEDEDEDEDELDEYDDEDTDDDTDDEDIDDRQPTRRARRARAQSPVGAGSL